MTAIRTPRMNASHPLEMSAAISIAATPIAIVSRRPMGSRPGWKRRPSAPTSAPTMRNQMKCMGVEFPRPNGRETLLVREQLGLLRLELLVGEDPGVVEVAELHDAGILTDEEFEAKKAQLLTH